jgi:hypothetical protein
VGPCGKVEGYFPHRNALMAKGEFRAERKELAKRIDRKDETGKSGPQAGYKPVQTSWLRSLSESARTQPTSTQDEGAQKSETAKPAPCDPYFPSRRCFLGPNRTHAQR